MMLMGNMVIGRWTRVMLRRLDVVVSVEVTENTLELDSSIF